MKTQEEMNMIMQVLLEGLGLGVLLGILFLIWR